MPETKSNDNHMHLDRLRFQLHNAAMMWAVTLLVMLEDDAAMLAFMLS